ncbi:hypothetical protein ABB29_15285 [Pseudoxanthomonas dokdonensis]|uniref:Uncharacterized protein n=2 Tax=Pseudoxanthomonas dokdonensis TaxID=344882 RepID=A0A0R0CNZ2_9GAMM|nr:hypothetical protein ABB29_15285 [Pseudoxanthomonas dokdonensis]
MLPHLPPAGTIMLRSILAILAGVVAAFALMFVLQLIGLRLFPLPPGSVLDNEVDLARLVAQSSPGQKTWVVLEWALASFAGGWVAARLGRDYRRGSALVVGVVITVGVLMNASVLPQPLWMSALGLLLPVPLAWCGWRLATRPR